MAKSLVNKTDLKILYYLDLNARRPFSDIARKLKMSVDAVQYRVTKMQKEGVIRGFYTVIDASALGFLSCRFFLKFRYCTPQNEEKIIDYFVKDPQYWWIDSIDGFRDMGVACWLKNTNEFAKKKNELVEKIGENVSIVQESVYSGFHQYSRAYLARKEVDEEEEIVLCRSEKRDINELDWKILQTIANNARLSSIKIAQTTKVTPATILNRIKQMEKMGIIRRYRPMMDMQKLGYYWYKVEFTLANQQVKKKLLDFSHKHPNIVYAYETIGGADLEIELEVESYEKFRKVLDEIRAKFGNEIESCQHLLWYKEHKITYLPEV